MEFSKLRHRIIFLKPCNGSTNGMSENVVTWRPYHPAKKRCYDELYVTSDNRISWKNGVLQSTNVLQAEAAVWACVEPKTGREYEEAQKTRAEAKYTVTTRYFDEITANMKILHGLKVFYIESVLNVGERNEQLQIIAYEVDDYGKEC